MRIVSLTCSNTEIVAALGLGEALVGVDDHSDWPGELLSPLPRLGPDLQIDLDALEALEPDLVLASLTVPGHETVLEGLEQRGIPHMALDPSSVEDICRDIEAIALRTGVAGRAAPVVAELREAMAGSSAPPPADAPRILIQWWPRPVISPGRESWASDAVRAAGGVHVLDHEEVKSRPLEDAEVAGLAPDVIIIAWCGVEPAKYRTEVVYRNPAFRSVPAVVRRRVFCIPEAFLGRPGPRLVHGVEALRQVVERVRDGRPAPDDGRLEGGWEG